jgi:hypothetical protein
MDKSRQDSRPASGMTIGGKIGDKDETDVMTDVRHQVSGI